MNRLMLVLAAVTSFAAVAEEAPVPAANASSEAKKPDPQTEEQLGFLQGKIAAFEESFSAAQSDLDVLKKIKISGYVQARYQYNETSRAGLNASGGGLVNDQFSIRRGRVKAQYLGSWSSFLVQIDAVPSGISLKDAEAWLIEPWTGKRLTLIMGQTKWPFGYEVVQSSGDREFPERTRVVRAFARNERDRGAKILANLGALRIMAGVFDGNGTDNRPNGSTALAVDNDKNKDVIGRVGVDLKWLSAGVSGWYGQTLKVGDYTGNNNILPRTYDRWRVGADAQVYLDVLPIGSTALKGEVIRGSTYFNGSGVEQFGKPAFGWYAAVIQNIGLNDLVAVRYDYFDGALGTAAGASSADPTKPLDSNGIGTAGILVTHYFDESLKISAVYEIPMTDALDQVVDPKDNLFTLQLQAKF